MPPRGLPSGYQPDDPLIHFRRIPGTRRYYNPVSGEEVTEHFVIRRYRPTRSTEERASIRQVSQFVAIRQAETRRGLVSTYVAKKASEGVIISEGEASRSAEFNVLYNNLRTYSYNSRVYMAQGDSAARQALNEATGPYAQTLVDLGRRLPTDDWPVGMSPAGHINNTVLPALGGG